MRFFLLALKRQLRGGALPAFCLLLIAAVFASSYLGDADSLTPAGVCNLDRSEVAQAVTLRLVGDGFVRYEDEDAMRRDLARGKLDAAVLLPDGFGGALLSDDPAGCASFFTASGAFVPELFRNQANAALFAEKTPYLTAQSLREAGAEFQDEAVFDRYRAMTEDGSLFSFRVLWEDEDGESAEELPSYVMGTLSLLLFAGVMIGTAGLLAPRGTEPVRRIGGKRAFLSLTLPSWTVRIAFWGAAAVCGLLLAGLAGHDAVFGLIGPALVYLILLAGFSAAAQSVLRRNEAVYGFLFVEIMLSLLLLPIWADAALLFPVLSWLRILLPPYWLWISAARPGLCLLAALLLLLFGGWILFRETARRAMKQ